MLQSSLVRMKRISRIVVQDLLIVRRPLIVALIPMQRLSLRLNLLLIRFYLLSHESTPKKAKTSQSYPFVFPIILKILVLTTEESGEYKRYII